MSARDRLQAQENARKSIADLGIVFRWVHGRAKPAPDHVTLAIERLEAQLLQILEALE